MEHRGRLLKRLQFTWFGQQAQMVGYACRQVLRVIGETAPVVACPLRPVGAAVMRTEGRLYELKRTVLLQPLLVTRQDRVHS